MCWQQISTVEYVDNTKRRTPFIAADGDAETQRIGESLHDWCSVVNELVWSKYVDRLGLYQSTVMPKKTEQNLFVCVVKSEAEVSNNERMRSKYCIVVANYRRHRAPL